MPIINELYNGKEPSNLYLIDAATIKKLHPNAKKNGFIYFNLDGEKIANMHDFFALSQIELNFPAYFGFNWDAFYDCMRDFSWWYPHEKFMIVYNAFHYFARNDPKWFAVGLETLSDIVNNIDEDTRMYFLLCGDEKSLPPNAPKLLVVTV